MSARFHEESLEVMKEIEREIILELYDDSDTWSEIEEQDICVCSSNESCTSCYVQDYDDLIQEEKEHTCCYLDYGNFCSEKVIKGYEFCSDCLNTEFGLR